MLQLNYISARGDTMSLVNNPFFHLKHIDGQTTAGTSISSAVVGGIDGDTVNNIQATPRTIIIDLQPREGVNVEEAKNAILKVIKIKQRGALVWTQNGKAKTITGVVDNINMPRWTNNAIMQISLHCEQPFWEDVNEIIQQINEITSFQYFTASGDMLCFTENGVVFGEYDATRTKTFHNSGDVAAGLEITIYAHDTVTNPIIYDQHGNFFGVGYENETGNNPFIMKRGDVVVITTHKGRKTVKHNGVAMFNKIKPKSIWLQLEAGDNTYTINSDDQSVTNMSFSITYKQRYI